MARVSIKYPCGTKVSCKGVPGMVTAVFIRGKARAYEFSYLSNDGDPKCVTAEEFELQSDEPNQLGFKKCQSKK